MPKVVTKILAGGADPNVEAEQVKEGGRGGREGEDQGILSDCKISGQENPSDRRFVCP